jgi:hypothetical protein
VHLRTSSRQYKVTGDVLRSSIEPSDQGKDNSKLLLAAATKSSLRQLISEYIEIDNRKQTPKEGQIKRKGDRALLEH